MTSNAQDPKALSLTTLPLEVLRMILDKTYEGPHNLIISKSPQITSTTTASTLSITPLLLSHHIYTESLDAIHRSNNNTITLKHQTMHPDLSNLHPSPVLTTFLQTVTTVSLPNFPYDSTILKSWKETCPKLHAVIVSNVYSPTTDPTVHSTLMTPSYVSLLRGDIDTTFANAAISRILTAHPTFRLAEIPNELSLTFPNVIDFWSPYWEREYYHDNRVLILSLSITNTKTYVSGKSFKNRIRNLGHKQQASCMELPRFSDVDYEVKFAKGGNVKELDYDPVKDCFRTPYS